MRAPITFKRPDPTEFVLLVAKDGRRGVIAGTDNFKPGGTEWATEQDLLDAGYVPLATAERAVRTLARKLADFESAEQTDVAMRAALGLLAPPPKAG